MASGGDPQDNHRDDGQKSLSTPIPHRQSRLLQGAGLFGAIQDASPTMWHTRAARYRPAPKPSRTPHFGAGQGEEAQVQGRWEETKVQGREEDEEGEKDDEGGRGGRRGVSASAESLKGTRRPFELLKTS